MTYRPSVVLVGMVLLLTTGLAGCVATPTGAPGGTTAPPAEQRPEPAPPAPPATVKLVFVGDLMLDRTPGQAIAQGYDPFAAVGSLLGSADVAVGNLECVIATVGEKVPKAYNFRCNPRNVPLLARRFAAVTVANNHAGDYGPEAFAEMLGLLEQGGLSYFGGGRTAAQAHAPLLVERNGIRLAFLGYDEVELRSYAAGPDTPGVAWSDDDQVAADIAAARAKADFVIVYPHWGLEYHREPSERQQALARKMIDAGADLVVGSHPHVTESVEYYKDRLIVYSLGNFVFDDFKDVPDALNEPSRTSWVLRVTLSKSGLVEWDTVVARTDDSGFPQAVVGAGSPCGKAGSKEIATCKAE
jgi:poly-gamma-glutamate synthesis protein (capsule biosynthesis protein)